MKDRCVIIGAGPAGLMAADRIAAAGLPVLVVDHKPSVGRKFLMAGKSGLNLTKDEPLETFLGAYGPAAAWLKPMIAEFGPAEVQSWAQALGQEVFTGTTKRVFPKAMKASPLLRAWMARLGEADVEVRTRWRWTGFEGDALCFDTPEGRQGLTPPATVIAVGGASWARLGSDGAWAEWMPSVAAFAPSNVGLRVSWSEHMAPFLGAPLKGIALHCGDQMSRGEIVLSDKGIEGGGIYALSPQLREGHDLIIDLMPDVPADTVRDRLSRHRGKASLTNHLRKVLKLGPAQRALLNEFGRPLPTEPTALANRIKALHLIHEGPRPMDEAISTAGGLRRDAVDDTLMLRDRPGIFAAGEMLDWDAPTGGYLLTACLATGRWAGDHAVRWINSRG